MINHSITIKGSHRKPLQKKAGEDSCKMDYETFLFNLSPILQNGETRSDTLDYGNSQSTQNLLQHLDQLAVSLRSEANRNIFRDSGALDKLLSSCLYTKSTELKSELIRCLANSVVDNDDNRNCIIESDHISLLNSQLITNMENILKNQDEFEIGKRSIIFVRNLCLEEIPMSINEQFRKVFEDIHIHLSKNVTGIMQADTGLYLLVLEFYTDMVRNVIDAKHSGFLGAGDLCRNIEVDLSITEHFSNLLCGVSGQFDERVETEQDSDDEDGDVEEPEELTILLLTSQLLEFHVTSLKENDPIEISILKNYFTCLFKTLNILEKIPVFPSKLIELRRISYTINMLSCNSPLFKDILFFQELLSSSYEQNQGYNYYFSSLFFCLSNCITSSKDCSQVLKTKSSSLESFSLFANIFSNKIFNTDPWCYQSFLDLMRKLITIVNYPENVDDVHAIWKILIGIQPSLQVIADIAHFFYKLLEKLVVILPGKLLFDSRIPIKDLILNQPSNTPESSKTIACLLLAKMHGYFFEDPLLVDLIEYCIDVEPSNGLYDEQYLFQLFKSFGIFFQTFELDGEMVFTQQKLEKVFDNLFAKIEYVHENIVKAGKTSAADLAVKNNCRFLCGILVKEFASQINATYGPNSNTDCARLQYLKRFVSET